MHVDGRHKAQIMACTHMKGETHKGVGWNTLLLDITVEESP